MARPWPEIFMKKITIVWLFILFAALLFPATNVLAMPVGTLLFRTSGGDKMYGYNSDDLIISEKGKLSHIYSGHVAIYVGQENGIDYIVEMQPKGAIKVPAKNFVNDSLGEKFVGAKLPISATPLQTAKAVAIAKNLAENNLAYDFDFKYQKGPNNGQWTCTGLTEKVYESANISNPTNLKSLEYNPNFYAVDITQDGYDNSSIYNSSGDCFSENYEFSKIERKTDMLLPAPELIGFDVGLEYGGDRYMFLPYTQFLQNSLKDVPVDINLSSSFSEPEVRGNSPILGLVLKWSLINNPISTVKNLALKVGNTLVAIKDKVFPDNSIALAENTNSSSLPAATSTKASTAKATTTTSKATSTKTVAAKTVAAQSSTVKSTTPTTPTKTAVPVVTANKTTATTTTTKAVSKPTTTSSAVSAVSKSTATTTLSLAKSTSTSSVKEPIIYYSTSTPVTYQSSSTPSVSVVRPTSSPNTTTTPPPTIYETPEDPAIFTEPEAAPEPETPIALIAKIYSNGADDWLEIVNTTGNDFDLAAYNYRLEKAKTAADPTLIMRFGNETDGVYPGGTVIKAYGSYLVASDSASADITAKADAIITKEAFSWTEDSYTIYLGTGSISSDDDADIVDKLGYGDATYYEGASAEALQKGYALERKASATSTIESMSSGGLQEFWPRLYDSDDNSNDFILVPYDLAVIESENAKNNPGDEAQPTNSELFSNPNGLNSENLIELWHFDECYGETAFNELQVSGGTPANFDRADKWLPGIWGCAASISSYNTKTTKTKFYSPLNPNQATINFYYRNTGSNFGLTLKFSNTLTTSKPASIYFAPYFTEIYGFPGPEGRISGLLWPADNKWHQVSIVINQSDKYWSMYLDGQEVHRYEYIGVIQSYEYLELIGNQSEALAVDELSIWDRSLPVTEIRTINLLNQPFNPYIWPPQQTIAKLEHYWSFDENTGLLANDSAGISNMPVKFDAWDIEGRDSSGLQVGQSVILPLTDQSYADLALSFWWRNTSSPNEGRLHISLKKGTTDILSLKPTSYGAGFSFNGVAEYFLAQGQSLIPNDNKWHHLALTYDSHRLLLSFYLDGEKKFDKQFVKLKSDEKINSLEIVRENWPSSIDELKVWSGLLTATQVKAEYDALK
jgi:hypothetical protein